jgi:hypothetical protein
MLTITVAYVIDLSWVAIRLSFLGSKPGKTTEVDQVAARLVDEIIRQMLQKCLGDACYTGGTGWFSLERTPRFGPYSPGNQGKVLRREPSVCCKNIKSEDGT